MKAQFAYMSLERKDAEKQERKAEAEQQHFFRLARPKIPQNRGNHAHHEREIEQRRHESQLRDVVPEAV